MGAPYGSQVVLGDRDQNATIHRLTYYTRYLMRQDSHTQVGWQYATCAASPPADRPCCSQDLHTGTRCCTAVADPCVLQADMRRLHNMMDSGRREDGASGPVLDQPTSTDVGEAGRQAGSHAYAVGGSQPFLHCSWPRVGCHGQHGTARLVP